MTSASMRALAVHYPSVLRSNEYWLRNHPEMVAQVAERGAGKVWSASDADAPSALFDETMRPYLDDPFRGTRDRRVLGPGETGLGMERAAIGKALDAAGLSGRDIDLLISVGFLSTHVGVGNGAYLAQSLGLECPAINLETACSGSLVAFQTACAFVTSGQYRRVLVSVSCTYSIQCEPSGSLAITSGDGAAAFIVEAATEGYGLLGGRTYNTASTCGALAFELVADELGAAPRVRATASKSGGKMLRNTARSLLERTTRGALEAADVDLEDISFFIFNTPTAWYIDFCVRALGIDRARTIDTYPLYANTGPALTTGNLFHALAADRIAPGDLVLLYSVGSVSTVSAAVVRWEQTALGPMPPSPEAVE